MSKAAIKTAPGCSFHSAGHASNKQRLFTVTPGIPIADALQGAYELLDTMNDAIYAAAMGDQPLQDNPAWLVNHALESAKAVIESIIRGLPDTDGDTAQPAKE